MAELMLQVSGYAQKITRISGIRRTVTVTGTRHKA